MSPPQRGFALAPADVSRALSEGLGADLRCTRVELVRPSQSRPIYHCHLAESHAASPTLGDVVIAKGHGRGDGRRVHEAGTILWERGFGADRRLRIPRPIAFVPERAIALQELAIGSCLYESIDDPAPAAAHLPRVAAWLVKLHAVPVTDLGDIAPVGVGVVDKLRSHADALAEIRPTDARRIEDLAAAAVESLTQPADGCGEERDVVTHGDFQPKNIHVGGDSVVVIDLDRVALSSPARDVGHFLAQCMTMSFVRTGHFAAIDCWTTPFLDAYDAGSPDGALDALPAFFSVSMIEILYYRLVVRPVRDASFVDAWLDEAERWWERAT